MSGTSVVTMVEAGSGGGGYYYRPPPFTAVQWQELEHQAMIYKYLMAGFPIPSELLVSIRRSFDSISSPFFNSLGYCSYNGKKFDPEPGRCKRTDGKKWRCAKDAHSDSKYCERHMHRGKGRNRSRKPVESNSTSHQSLSAVATPHTVTSGSNIAASNIGIFQSSGGNGVYQNIPFYSIGNSDGIYSGRNVAKFQIDYGSSGNDNRYVHGVQTDNDSGNHSLEASGSIGNGGMGCNNAGQSSELLNMGHHAYDSMNEITMSKLRQQQQQQQSFGENEDVKQEHHHHHSMQPFFDEWPTTKESWSNLGENGTWKNTNSKNMLSMSTPLDYSEFSASNAHSPDDV